MATVTSESDYKIDRFSKNILSGERLDSSESLQLDEFATLCHKISEQSGVMQRIDVVLQDDRALVQFTSLPPGSHIVYIESNRRLTRQDFSRIILNPVFHGDILTLSFKQRIKEERTNLLVAGGVGLLFCVVLFILGNSVAADYGSYLADPNSFPSVNQVIDFMIQTNEMLLTSATLFLSIFLVFTVAQSSKLQEDTRLFDNGLLHKFERDDRLIAIVTLTSLLLSIFNIVILGFPTPITVAMWQMTDGYVFALNKLSLISPLMTGLGIATLTFCFLALLYYLKRTMLITNRDMSRKVLEMARGSHKSQR